MARGNSGGLPMVPVENSATSLYSAGEIFGHDWNTLSNIYPIPNSFGAPNNAGVMGWHKPALLGAPYFISLFFLTANSLVCWICMFFVFCPRAHCGWHCMANHLAVCAM